RPVSRKGSASLASPVGGGGPRSGGGGPQRLRAEGSRYGSHPPTGEKAWVPASAGMTGASHGRVSRRMVLGAALALAACDGQARSQPIPEVAPFKLTAPYPVGTCVQASHLDDPAWLALAMRH